MEQGRKSLGEIFISGTEREPLPLVAPVLCHCSISSSSFWSVCRALVLLCGRASVIFTPPSSTHLISPPAPCKRLELQRLVDKLTSRKHRPSRNVTFDDSGFSNVRFFCFFLSYMIINWIYLSFGPLVEQIRHLMTPHWAQGNCGLCIFHCSLMFCGPNA